MRLAADACQLCGAPGVCPVGATGQRHRQHMMLTHSGEMCMRAGTRCAATVYTTDTTMQPVFSQYPLTSDHQHLHLALWHTQRPDHFRWQMHVPTQVCCKPCDVQTDKHVLDLLHSTCWPTQQAEAYSTIMGYGADALDVLAAAAQASTHSGLYLGMAFHAQTALLLVQAHLATQCIKQLLAAGAKAGAAADGGRSVSASAVDSTEDVLLELALQVVRHTTTACSRLPLPLYMSI